MDHALKGIKTDSWLKDANLLWVDLSIIKINPDTKQGKGYVSFRNSFFT